MCKHLPLPALIVRLGNLGGVFVFVHVSLQVARATLCSWQAPCTLCRSLGLVKMDHSVPRPMLHVPVTAELLWRLARFFHPQQQQRLLQTKGSVRFCQQMTQFCQVIIPTTCLSSMKQGNMVPRDPTKGNRASILTVYMVNKAWLMHTPILTSSAYRLQELASGWWRHAILHSSLTLELYAFNRCLVLWTSILTHVWPFW